MSEELHLTHRAKVKQASSKRYNSILAIIQERYGIGGEDDPDTPFIFTAEISNDLLDSHFTHMSESTLRNYTEDANRGVAFLKGHNWHELPVGYSVQATLEEGDKKRVVADFYTVRGMAETDDLIKRMQTGLLRDVSVGFHGGEMTCDICKRDFWDCTHWPGLKYEEKDGDTVRTVLATYTIENARLSEVSGVFDGSTPDAMILKAERFAAAGLLDAKQTELLEERYRIRLPHIKRFPVRKEVDMDEKEVLDLLVSRGLLLEDQRETANPLEVIDSMAKRLVVLEPEAAEGRQYRKDEIARALAEGVRAHGNDFDSASYKTILETAPLSTIQRMAADWKKVADSILPAGRVSVQEEDRPVKKTKVSLPATAYQ